MTTHLKERQSIVYLDDFEQIKKNIHQTNRLMPTTDKKQCRQFNNNQHINSSKTTLQNDHEQQKDKLLSDNLSVPKNNSQCAHCQQWKKWAVQQQKGMLQLQNKLIARQMALQTFIGQLRAQILIKTHEIQQFQQKCKGFSENISMITHNNQILNEQIRRLKQQKDNSLNIKINYQTPAKYDNTRYINQNKDQEMTKILKSKIQNTQEQKTTLVKASTIATKTMKGMQNNHKIDELTNKKLCFPSKKGENLDQIRLQNQILKEYNNTLLQQLQNTRMKKY